VTGEEINEYLDKEVYLFNFNFPIVEVDIVNNKQYLTN